MNILSIVKIAGVIGLIATLYFGVFRPITQSYYDDGFEDGKKAEVKRLQPRIDALETEIKEAKEAKASAVAAAQKLSEQHAEFLASEKQRSSEEYANLLKLYKKAIQNYQQASRELGSKEIELLALRSQTLPEDVRVPIVNTTRGRLSDVAVNVLNVGIQDANIRNEGGKK